MTTFAIIPAAGHSTRMGRPKLALPFGKGTVLQTAITTLRTGGVGHVLVVVGPHVADLIPLAEEAGAAVLRLDHETAEMRETVEAGLRGLEDRWPPRPDDAWLLVPGDHAALDAAVVRALVRAYERDPSATVLVPTFAGKRGHPTLFAWRLAEAVRRLPPGQGLNVLLRTHAAEVRELPWDNPSILQDLDTPADYARLQGPS